jgi:hypothetical protein
MRSKDIKSLLKLSVNAPSEGFTQALMQKIEHQQKESPSIKQGFALVYVMCLFIFLLSFVFTLPRLSFYYWTITIPTYALPVSCMLFIAYIISQIGQLHQMLQRNGGN